MKTESTLKPGLVRLEKYMAHEGISSRREAKELILGGLVLVNGEVVKEPGFGVDPEKDQISLKTELLPTKETVLLYKPRGLETNATTSGAPDISTRFPEYAHLSPIGRLDKDSEGLILLSNDGVLARILTQKETHVEKEYLVTVREEVTDEAVHIMSHGILLDGTMTKPAIVKRSGEHTFLITLTEGRKHQIRRMCDACHLTVTELVRVRIGFLNQKMKPAQTITLSQEEVEKLKVKAK